MTEMKDMNDLPPKTNFQFAGMAVRFIFFTPMCVSSFEKEKAVEFYTAILLHKGFTRKSEHTRNYLKLKKKNA